MLTINTNMGAMLASSQLNKLNTESIKLNEQSTTGKRINHASDDPAGMAIMMGMKSQMIGNKAAQSNISKGVDLLKSEEGMFKQFDTIYTNMKDLATKASSDTSSTEDRIKANTQIQEYMTQLDQIAKGTNYNNINLGDGTVTTINLQIGNDTSTHNKLAYTLSDMQTSALTITGGDVLTLANAQTFMDSLKTDMDNLATKVAKNGAVQERLSYANENLNTMNEGLTKSMSTIGDADLAQVAVDQAKNTALSQLAIKMMQMSNQQPLNYLSMFA